MIKKRVKGLGVTNQAEGVELVEYEVMINEADQILKIVFFDASGTAVGTFTATKPEGAYQLSEKILRGYDSLEGIT